jgi:hypothetical protein
MARHKRQLEIEAGGSRLPERWADEERKRRADAAEHCPHWCRVEVDLALKGGPRVGWTWGGRFRVDVRPQEYGRPCRYGRPSNGLYRAYWRGGIEELRGIFDLAAKRIRPVSEGCWLVGLYRNGLIPPEVGKQHGEMLRERLGEGRNVYTDKEYQQAARDLAEQWLEQQGFKLVTEGYQAPDGRIFADRPINGVYGWIEQQRG